MKKHFGLITTTTALMALPLISMTSCNNKQLETGYIVDGEDYVAAIDIGNAYKSTEYSFSLTLKEKCFIDTTESYFKVTGHRSHSFESPYINIKVDDNNKVTVTVNKDIIHEGYVFIYICVHKLVGYDNSKSSGFAFNDLLTSYPIENQQFTFAFQPTADNTAVDFKNSVIKVGNTTLTTDDLYIYEATIESKLYTFITIPADKVIGDIDLTLKAADAVNVTTTTYPEYKAIHLKQTAKNNAFYMYFNLADSDSYTLDTDKAEIFVGGVKLDTTKYIFGTYYKTIPFLMIYDQNVTGDITVDVPVVECYSLYANKPEEYATVKVAGEKIIKGKEYKFSVVALDGKEIQWDNANTYISVGDKKLTTTNSDFTTVQDPDTGVWTVTVKAENAIGDMYCHFITK